MMHVNINVRNNLALSVLLLLLDPFLNYAHYNASISPMLKLVQSVLTITADLS